MQYQNYNQQENNDKNAVNRQVWRKMYKEFEKYQPLSLEEEQSLIAAIQENKEQLEKVQAEINKLVLSNSKFVVSVAKRYATPSVPIEDLVQEGFIGLRQAAVKFVPRDNNKLITFAVYYIRRAMIGFIDRCTSKVKHPVKHTKELPIPECECDGDMELAYVVDEGMQRDKPPVYVRVKSCEAMSKVDTSSVEEVEVSDIKDAIWSYVDSLCEIEQRAIRLQYGLDGGPALKKNAIAKELKINRLLLNSVLDSAMKNLRKKARFDF